jgi:hypothetical protein
VLLAAAEFRYLFFKPEAGCAQESRLADAVGIDGGSRACFVQPLDLLFRETPVDCSEIVL